MGAEEFRVRLSVGSGVDAARAALMTIPRIKAGAWDGFFVYEDDDYILDLQVTRGAPDTTVEVGFALCQDASIDDFFARFVVRLAEMLGAESALVEGQQVAVFRPGWTGLAEHIRGATAEPRRLWQLDFGAETAKLGRDDAMRIYRERQ